MTQPDISSSKLRALRSAASKEGKIDQEVLNELAMLDEEHRAYVFRPETRCRVCNSEANSAVNKMLSHAATYTDILRALKPINDVLPKAERITYNSVWTHAKRHFPIEQAAQAVYRRIVEKRAEEYDIDFVQGVNGALTPMAYLDVTMQKGFENLIDDATRVDVETGLRAAEKLHAITQSKDASTGDMAEVMLRLNKVVEAVKSTVPADMWPEILAKIEDVDYEKPLDAEVVEEDEPEVSGYDPGDPDFTDDDPETADDSEHR